jgi:hypothetical protein
MLRLACPTGCAGFVRRPYPRRTEPVRCPNCRAWLAAPERAEDGGLSQAILLASPGRGLPSAMPRPRRPRRVLVAAILVAAGLAAGAALAERARGTDRVTETHPR